MKGPAQNESLNRPRECRNARTAAFLQRVAAGQLSCPYCEDALRVTMIGEQRMQLRCPTCGFTETPDAVEAGG